ncbi:hypothetical protein ACTFIR_007556 [Dictyostelium discoideum]
MNINIFNSNYKIKIESKKPKLKRGCCCSLESLYNAFYPSSIPNNKELNFFFNLIEIFKEEESNKRWTSLKKELIEYGSLNGKKLASDRFQTDVAIKLRSQTDITQCRKAITDLVSDKSSKRRPSHSASNTGEKFPMKKNHAGTNHNSNSRNSFDAQAENIRAAILPGLKSDLRVDIRKIRSN